MFNFLHPGGVVYMFFVCETHILFYDIQYQTYHLLLRSTYGVDTDDVNYDYTY